MKITKSNTKTHVLNSGCLLILHSGDGMAMHYGYNAFLLPTGSSCSKPRFWCQEILTVPLIFVFCKDDLLFLKRGL